MRTKSQLFTQIILVLGLSVLWAQITPAQEPSEADKALQQGRVFLARRNYDAAIDAFKKAISENGKNAEAHYYLGLAYTRKGLWSQAEPAFRQAIELREGGVYPEALLGLAGYSYFQRSAKKPSSNEGRTSHFHLLITFWAWPITSAPSTSLRLKRSVRPRNSKFPTLMLCAASVIASGYKPVAPRPIARLACSLIAPGVSRR